MQMKFTNGNPNFCGCLISRNSRKLDARKNKCFTVVITSDFHPIHT